MTSASELDDEIAELQQKFESLNDQISDLSEGDWPADGYRLYVLESQRDSIAYSIQQREEYLDALDRDDDEDCSECGSPLYENGICQSCDGVEDC